ncbi:MAG: alanine racemase [Cyanobacteria bacterium HKST-UBA04]|nr:alanine racemase [Cyanobacteria bacterium HKST-UBA04]
MKLQRHLPTHTRRDAWVEVDLNAVEANLATLRRPLASGLAIMAVLKADAYGHGAPLVLPCLEASGVSAVGVASIDEAIQMRESGCRLPILVLGASPDWSLHELHAHDIQATIFNDQHVQSLERLFDQTGRRTTVQIKVDTGMHRIGVPWQVAPQFIERCQHHAALDVAGVFSHFAWSADEAFSAKQRQRWQGVLGKLSHPPGWVHIANSDASLRYDYSDCSNMVRIGLPLFGYKTDPSMPVAGLKPAMALKARVVHLQTLEPGEGVSYNQTFVNTTGAPMRLATLPLGYADGVPRGLSNHMAVLYGGQRLRQVGNITMDQLMIDVTPAQDVHLGDVVTLIGSSGDQAIGLDSWAAILNTIEYEVMCGLRVRLPKTVVRND